MMVLGSRATMGYVLGSGAGAAAAWYLASGTISAANVAEWVENPTIGQLYAGANQTGNYTIAIRTTWDGLTGGQHAFDTQTGRMALGVVSTANGFFNGLWRDISLFNTSDSVYFLTRSASGFQAYRNNVAIGTAYTATTNISGTTRWRAAYLLGSSWAGTVPRAAVYNIALDATQRAALYASMAA